MWKDFAAEVDIEREPLTHFPSKLYGYYEYCDQIRNVLLADGKLVALLAESQPDDRYNGHLLTQDFIYCIANHFVNFNLKPRDFDSASTKE